MVKEGKCTITEIEDKIDVLQQIVGGYIEVLSIDNEFLVVMDDEGKLKNKPCYALICGEPIAGDFFICARDGEDFADITKGTLDLAEKYMFLRR